MGKRLVILVLGLFYLIPCWAQPSLTIHGTIVDSAGAALIKATIRIWNDRDTINLLSGAGGEFAASIRSPETTWHIQVTMKGYGAYQDKFGVPENSRFLILSPIHLQAAYQELETVIIRRERPMTLKGDTLSYNAGAYLMRDGSMLADLLKKLPGIRVDPDSSVYVEGKKIGKVLLDGKEFFQGDVKNAIRNLPYDIIDRIEIIDDYGDQGRLTGLKTGEPDKVMNVVLRQDRRNGQFGNLETGPGGHSQYLAAVTANIFAGDRKFSLIGAVMNTNPFGEERIRLLNLSYADNWSHAWSTSGGASISANDHLFKTSMVQDSYFDIGITHLEQATTNSGSGQQQQLNYEWLYVPSSNTRLRINASFNDQSTEETDQTNLSSTFQDSGFSKISKSLTTNQLTGNNIISKSEFYFENISPHSGHRFSANVNINYGKITQSGDNLSLTQVYTDSLPGQVQQHYRLDDAETKWDIDGGLHYFFPFGKKSLLETSYTVHQTIEESSRNWRQPDTIGQGWQTVDSLSNDYNYKTLINDFRTAYSYHSEKVDLDAGLTAEPGNLNGEPAGKSNSEPVHYVNFLPLVAVSYSLNNSQKFRFGYNSSVIMPTVQQIQPVTDLSNPQYPITGNPGLRPAISRSANLNYDLNILQPTNYYGLGIGVSYTVVENQIVSNIVQFADTGSIIQQTYFENVNGNKTEKLNWRADLPAIIGKRLKISCSGSISNIEAIFVEDYLLAKAMTLSTNQNLNIVYIIPDKSELNLYFSSTYSASHYSTSGNSPVYASSLNWGMNNRHYLLKNWKLSYEFMQTFNRSSGQGLSRGPTVLNVHLERSFLSKRQLTCTLSGLNLINENASLIQTATQNPTTITSSRSNFIARNILLTVQWQFERFPKKH